MIGAYTSGSFLNRTKKEDMTTQFYQGVQPLDSLLITSNDDISLHRNLTGGVNFAYKPYEGADWQTTFDYQLFHFEEDQNQYSRDHALQKYFLKGDLGGDIHLYAVQTMMELPFKKRYKLGVGAKSTFTGIDNQAVYFNKSDDTWEMNKAISNRFKYDENINAGYLQLNGILNEKLSFEAGLRIENTRFRAELDEFTQQTDSVFKRNYTNLFPNGGVQYKISDKHTLAFLYARRIVRPNYRDLNPFIEIRDEFLYEKGNTELKPQLTDNFEISYIFKNKFSFNFFLAYTHDPIMKTFVVDEEDRTWVLSDNLNSDYATGLRFNGSNIQLLPCWVLNTSMTFIYKKYQWDGENRTEKSNKLTPFVQLNNQFRLPKDWGAEVNIFYQGKMVEGQAILFPMWMVSGGVGKNIFNNKVNLKLYANDILGSVRPRMDVNSVNMQGIVKERQDNTYVGISLSYLFNKGKQTNNSRLRSGIDESKRINL